VVAYRMIPILAMSSCSMLLRDNTNSAATGFL
jgi:hypothetical protein